MSTEGTPPIQPSSLQTPSANISSAATIAQEESSLSFVEEQAGDSTMNTVRTHSKTLEERIKRKEKTSETEQEEEIPEEVEPETMQTADFAEGFQKKNPELKASSLLTLKERISIQDTTEEIIAKVFESYPDPTLADEALDFLLATATDDLKPLLQEAKALLNQRFPREISAGRNILETSQLFAEKGLGSADALRDMYRDITGNPREPQVLFQELSQKFTFESLKSAIGFLLHAIGKDFRSKGPSIAPGELSRLFTEVRTLQAILGVYRYFIKDQPRLLQDLEKNGFPPNDKIEFERLVKLFMKYLDDRYPASQKILDMSHELHITDELVAQEIVFTHMYEALRQISSKLFRSPQHKDDVRITFLEALDSIDQNLEALEEEEEKKQRDTKKL